MSEKIKLKLSKYSEIHKYSKYTRVDYRDTIFRNTDIANKVVGCGPPDYIISDKSNKTFMPFLAESPFAKDYFEFYVKTGKFQDIIPENETYAQKTLRECKEKFEGKYFRNISMDEFLFVEKISVEDSIMKYNGFQIMKFLGKFEINKTHFYCNLENYTEISETMFKTLVTIHFNTILKEITNGK